MALLAKAGTCSEVNGKRNLAERFALFAMFSGVGAGFWRIVDRVGLPPDGAFAGAGGFVVALTVLYFCLSVTHRSDRATAKETLACCQHQKVKGSEGADKRVNQLIL